LVRTLLVAFMVSHPPLTPNPLLLRTGRQLRASASAAQARRRTTR
jgi:hypothetical protein